MPLITRWNLEIFKTEDLLDAKQVAWVLHSRGFKRVSLHATPGKNEYKTYAKIDFVGKELQKFYYVEYMARTTSEKVS